MNALRSLTIGLVILGIAAPAWADNIGNATGLGNVAAGAKATSSSRSSATGIGVGIGQGGHASASSNPVQHNTQVNTQVGIQTTDVTTVQGQQQGQGQDQQQGQLQGQQQKQQANNAGNHQDITIDVPRQAPPAIPASLAVSSLTCYGSWSIAASTPFGGVGAGFPTKDEDCERSRNALILVQLGLKDAALALLGQNEDTAAAMQAAGVKYPGQKVAAVEMPDTELKLNTPLGQDAPKVEPKSAESTNFGERAHLTIPEALVANLAAQSSGVGM